MTQKNKCPSRDWLERLVDGNVTQEQEAKLARHLDHCHQCQQTLGQIGDPQSLTHSGLIDLADPVESSREQSSLIQEKLSAIRSKPPDGSSFSSGYADVLPWLDESEQGIGQLAEFELTRFIGRGGMGVVFEAFDGKLHRRVAIKLMSPGLLADPTASQRFLREARAAAKINHVNVVTIHGVDEIRGLPWLVMELIEGRSLEDQLRKSNELPLLEILKIARQTALGLDAAHKCGITHRDIKPSNLMLDKRAKRIKIADFGLASTINDTSFTRSGMLVGTPDFASPEQVNSLTVDSRSDLFSLGSVLYLLCTRDLPFSEDSLIGTLDAVRNRELPDISTKNTEIPAELSKVIHRLMQKDPADRYQSAGELLAAIDRVSKSEKSGQRQTKPASERTLPKKWIAIVAGLIGIAILIAVLYLNRPDKGTTPQHASNPEGSANVTESDDLPRFVEVKTNQQLMEILDGTGDVILKLNPGQTYTLDRHISTEDRALTFQSDPDDHARIEIDCFEEQPSLQFENCEVEFHHVDVRNYSSHDTDEPFLLCSAGQLRFVDSFVIGDREGNCIELAESSLSLESSVFTSPETLFNVYPMPEQSIAITDSVLVSTTNFEVGGATKLKLNADESEFLNHQTFSLYEDDLEEFFMLLEAKGCTFKSANSLFSFLTDSAQNRELVMERFGDRIEWDLTDCRIPGSPLFTEVDDEEKLLRWKDLNPNPATDEKYVDASEDFIDSLVERMLQLEFDTISQFKETVAD